MAFTARASPTAMRSRRCPSHTPGPAEAGRHRRLASAGSWPTVRWISRALASAGKRVRKRTLARRRGFPADLGISLLPNRLLESVRITAGGVRTVSTSAGGCVCRASRPRPSDAIPPMPVAIGPAEAGRHDSRIVRLKPGRHASHTPGPADRTPLLAQDSTGPAEALGAEARHYF
jgi:hypothetical protein